MPDVIKILACWIGIVGCVLASPGSKTFKEGKSLYEAGKYEEAISLFQQCIQENPTDYGAKGNYMIALCYKRLDRCSKAAVHFKLALSLDAEKGGASSMEKFEEQLNACRLTKESLANISPPELTENQSAKQTNYSLIWILGIISVGGIVLLVFVFVKRKRAEQQEIKKVDEQGTDDLYKISEILFREAVWLKVANEFGKERTERLQVHLQEEYSHLVENKNPIGIRDLLRKVKYLETNPQKVFEEEEL